MLGAQADQVRVHEQEHLRLGGEGAAAHRRSLTAVLGQVQRPDRPELAGDRSGPIPRAIIHHHDLGQLGSRQQRAQHLADAGLFVVSRDHRGNSQDRLPLKVAPPARRSAP